MATPSTTLAEPRQLLYAGNRVSVYGVDVPGRTGGLVRRELVTHPGSVVILPVLDNGQVCLIRNHRHTLGETLLELPAGTLELGELTLPAAQRELAEETGYTAAMWRLLTEFWVSPGIYAEKMWLYLARGLTAGPQKLDEGEEIETVHLGWDEAVRMALRGTLRDAKTILGLLLWDRLRHEPRE